MNYDSREKLFKIINKYLDRNSSKIIMDYLPRDISFIITKCGYGYECKMDTVSISNMTNLRVEIFNDLLKYQRLDNIPWGINTISKYAKKNKLDNTQLLYYDSLTDYFTVILEKRYRKLHKLYFHANSDSDKDINNYTTEFRKFKYEELKKIILTLSIDLLLITMLALGDYRSYSKNDQTQYWRSISIIKDVNDIVIIKDNDYHYDSELLLDTLLTEPDYNFINEEKDELFLEKINKLEPKFNITN